MPRTRYYLIDEDTLANILALAEDDAAQRQLVSQLQGSLAAATTEEGNPLPQDIAARIQALPTVGAPTPVPVGDPAPEPADKSQPTPQDDPSKTDPSKTGTAVLESHSADLSKNVGGGEGTGKAAPEVPGSGDRAAQPGSPSVEADAPPTEATDKGPISDPKPPGDGQPANGM